jgi:hypothetical protein
VKRKLQAGLLSLHAQEAAEVCGCRRYRGARYPTMAMVVNKWEANFRSPDVTAAASAASRPIPLVNTRQAISCGNSTAAAS